MTMSQKMLFTFSTSVVIIFVLLVKADDLNRNCRDRDRPITDEKSDLFKLIDAKPKEKLVLDCNYCNENTDIEPRIWYKVDRVGSMDPHEVKLDMENENELNRIYVNSEHSLIIKNLSEVDVGIYFCLGLQQHSKDEKYNYLVDLVFEPSTSGIESGNISAWLKYHDDNFSPINKLFNESQGPEFVYLREHLKLAPAVTSQWESWGPCDVCGRPNSEGIRKKTGHCRIKLRKSAQIDTATYGPEERFYLKVDAVSCRSQTLATRFPGHVIEQPGNHVPEWNDVEIIMRETNITRRKIKQAALILLKNDECFAESSIEIIWSNSQKKQGTIMTSLPISFKECISISNLTKVIADFIQLEKCEGTCNPVADKGWKVGKSSGFKYRKTFVLAEKSHLTLVCPESTLENNVIWKKSGMVFKPGDTSNPNAFVGAFNTFYLVDVTKDEAGNYTCQVDDIKMQQVRIFITTTSSIITGEFARDLMYLGFILSLTSWCYCAGLIINWNRRKTFKGYQELKEEHPEEDDDL